VLVAEKRLSSSETMIALMPVPEYGVPGQFPPVVRVAIVATVGAVAELAIVGLMSTLPMAVPDAPYRIFLFPVVWPQVESPSIWLMSRPPEPEMQLTPSA